MRRLAPLLLGLFGFALVACESILGIGDHELAVDGGADAGGVSDAWAGPEAGHADGAEQGDATNDSDATEPPDAPPQSDGTDQGDGPEPSDAADDADASDAAQDQAVPCSSTSCAAGCCGMDGECHTQENSSYCGTSGGSCTVCSSAQTCTGGSCVDKCTSANCATGCCDSNGVCQTTMSDTQCGTNGASCGGCTGTNHCVAGQCGCTSSTDCPIYQACNLTTHMCSAACGASATCNAGCCNSATNTCAQGTASAACGIGGAATCNVCTGASKGSACETTTGSCGCNVAGDCPTGMACNTTTHQCSSSCAGGLTCEGACCDGTNCQLPTAKTCSGPTPQTCGSNGQWVNGTITLGQCGVQCTMSTCNGLEYVPCVNYVYGTGSIVGGQCGACTPNGTQCVGTNPGLLETCTSNGTWGAGVLTVGACGVVCQPSPLTQCVDSNDDGICGSDGQWSSVYSCGSLYGGGPWLNEGCSDNQCQSVCVEPGSC